jgi:hypothetical protein
MNRRALFPVWVWLGLSAAVIARPSPAHAAACGTTACGSATSVTYNGTPLTFAGAQTNGTVRSEIWYLTAPPSGAHNVAVTAPNATAVTATSMSFTGVNQTTPLGSTVGNIGTSTTPSVTTTSAVGEPLFDVMGAVGTTAPTVAGTTQTLRQTNTTANGLDHVVIGSSTAPGAGATSITMSWTIPSADWAEIAVPIKASTALTAVTVSDLTATLESDGVLVQWSDGYEPSTLGFYVYRADGTGARVQLNQEIIAGGALGGGASSFSWRDSTPGWDTGQSYWVEDVSIDGTPTWYGPVTPRASTTADAGGGAGGGGGASVVAIGTGDAPGAGVGSAPAQTDSTPAAGCTVAARDPRAAFVQLVLVLGLAAGLRRRGRLGLLVALCALAVGATGLLTSRPAAGAGGVSIDASATGTGASGLTFSHTMGAGANGLLVVGVVVPIQCDNTATDSGNCSACGVTCAQDISASVNSGLLALWHFDEGSGTTSADATGNGNTATLFNNEAWTTGYAGDAVEGDGSSAYVSASVGTWFGSNNTLSASAWTYVNANSNGPVVGIAGTNGWNMPFLSVRGSTVYGWLWGVPGTDQTTSPLSATVSLNAWHFLAITYDPNGGGAGIGEEIFYVDGSPAGMATGTYAPSGTTDTFTTNIPGAKPNGGVMNSVLLGKVDEVRAYNRVLSGAEVTALFGARLACSASTCAACSAGETACSGTCTTTATDVNNCGSCGHACNTAGGETCVGGTCTCTSGTDCSGTCTTTSTDPNNCGGCGIACGMPTGTALDSSLVGRWHLDEGMGTTSADSSGSGNTATLTNSPTWTTGYSGDAVSGNGSTSYVSANLGTYFGTNSPLTASCWVYATATTNGPLFGVSSIPGGGGWNMPFLSIAGSTVYGWLWGVPGTNSGTSPLSATVSLNNWHFLAITYTPSGASGTESFYVDGALSGTATGAYQPSGLVDTWTTDIPGAKPNAVTNSFLNGKVDEVRAYSRALSAAEITILYNARQTCSSSTCGGCAGGELLCGGDCTNKAIDPANCGNCGTTCNTSGGESCVSSSCGCASGTDCSTVCVDTTTNQNNCGSCGHPCGAATCASCGSGMVGLWHLDDGSGSTAADSSGNGHTATLNSSPTWVTGESGDALTFNGTSYLTAPLGTWFINNVTLSASAWVYATSTTNGPIFGVTDVLPGTSWDMPFLSINGSTVYGWLWQVNGNTPLSATVSLNAWHMLTITYDPNGGGAGVGQEIFYVDGVQSSSGTGTYSPASTQGGTTDFLTTQIQGAKPSGVNTILSGTIDELRGYNRVLSAGEISLLYSAQQTCVASSCGGCPTGTTSCGSNVCQNTTCGPCGSPCSGTQQCVSGTCM